MIFRPFICMVIFGISLLAGTDSLSQDPSSTRAVLTPSSPTIRELESRVSLDDVDRILRVKKLGRVDRFHGRIAICTTSPYSEHLKIDARQSKSIRELAESIQLKPSLLEPLLVDNVNVVSEKDAERIARPLVQDVKDQILFAEQVLETILTVQQNRQMLAIQSFILGPVALSDEVIAKACDLPDEERRAVERCIRETKTDAETEPANQTEEITRYFDAIDKLESSIWKAVPDDPERTFRRLCSEGKSICQTPAKNAKQIDSIRN